MPDYEDLAFKAAMTWGELCEWVYRIRYKLAEQYIVIFEYDNKYIQVGIVRFFENNEVRTEKNDLISKNVSYEQMKNIIDNLYGED